MYGRKKNLVGETVGKRPPQRPRHKCEDYFENDTKVIQFRFNGSFSDQGPAASFCTQGSAKTLFIIPADAHYYKSVEMLKQF
jgi:hypothetical protein